MKIGQLNIEKQLLFFGYPSLVKYDKVMENADLFVQKLSENNIEIFYLTGRYFHSMAKGTEQQLLNFNFPFDKNKLNVL